jgi:hypothetical protein
MIEIDLDLLIHIKDKISFHEEEKKRYEIEEDYLQCAYHRDEVIRLKKMIEC